MTSWNKYIINTTIRSKLDPVKCLNVFSAVYYRNPCHLKIFKSIWSSGIFSSNFFLFPAHPLFSCLNIKTPLWIQGFNQMFYPFFIFLIQRYVLESSNVWQWSYSSGGSRGGTRDSGGLPCWNAQQLPSGDPGHVDRCGPDEKSQEEARCRTCSRSWGDAKSRWAASKGTDEIIIVYCRQLINR